VVKISLQKSNTYKYNNKKIIVENHPQISLPPLTSALLFPPNIMRYMVRFEAWLAKK